MKAYKKIALEQTICTHRKLRPPEPHVCPFQQLIHEDSQEFCLCCEECEGECLRAAEAEIEREILAASEQIL